MDTVTIAYPYGVIDPDFDNCKDFLLLYDLQNTRRLAHSCPLIKVATNNIATGRNKIVEAFLESSTADWLLFVDTDQTFPPNLLDLMVESADADKRPILSALIMARRNPPHLPVSPACVLLDESQGFPRFVEPDTIPNERWWQVACTGSGCVLIHRRVLEALQQKWGHTAWPWFKYADFERPLPDGSKVWDTMGEDYTFSLRAAAEGFPSYVDTTIHVGHVKPYDFGVQDFWGQFPPEQQPRNQWVVIPTKNNVAQLRDLVNQLREQGDTKIVVVDNGAGRTTKNWLSTQKDLVVVDMPGAGIHHMWNAGAEIAIQAGPCNVTFLNDDVELGPAFVSALADALAADPELMVVSGNYDGRDGDPVVFTTELCGERYDGTGGLAGFAFQVRGELFAAGYRFPEECMWWFGDNDLLLSVLTAGFKAGIVVAASCVHLGGGGQTGNWRSPEMQQVLAQDQAAFEAKWADVLSPTS